MISHITILASLIISITLSACSQGNKKVQPEQSNIVSAGTKDELSRKYNLDKIRLPKGFSISVFAEVPNARSMCLSPSGVLYVGNRSGDKVFAVVDADKNGKAEKVYTIAKGLNSPNGVAFRDGALYIATISTIYRLDNIESNLSSPPKPIVVYDKLPTDEHHGWKFIAFGPDGKLYVPVGAPCNICDKENPVYASITRMNADGSGFEIFARGIRNTVGFTWHPDNKEMWFTENGRDNLGNDQPADELNHAKTAGMHFGYPYCHQGDILDPEFGKGKNCNDYTAPIQKLGPHVAALGLRFNMGEMFPVAYKKQLFIAEHGSWNRSEPIGYRVSLVNLDEAGNSKGYSVFADGWLQPDGKVLGRPVDVQFLPDGSMLVSDDYSGVIYRISFNA